MQSADAVRCLLNVYIRVFFCRNNHDFAFIVYGNIPTYMTQCRNHLWQFFYGSANLFPRRILETFKRFSGIGVRLKPFVLLVYGIGYNFTGFSVYGDAKIFIIEISCNTSFYSEPADGSKDMNTVMGIKKSIHSYRVENIGTKSRQSFVLNDHFFQKHFLPLQVGKKFFKIGLRVGGDNFGSDFRTFDNRFWKKTRMLFNKSFEVVKSTFVGINPISMKKSRKNSVCFSFIV